MSNGNSMRKAIGSRSIRLWRKAQEMFSWKKIAKTRGISPNKGKRRTRLAASWRRDGIKILAQKTLDGILLLVFISDTLGKRRRKALKGVFRGKRQQIFHCLCENWRKSDLLPRIVQDCPYMYVLSGSKTSFVRNCPNRFQYQWQEIFDHTSARWSIFEFKPGLKLLEIFNFPQMRPEGLRTKFRFVGAIDCVDTEKGAGVIKWCLSKILDFFFKTFFKHVQPQSWAVNSICCFILLTKISDWEIRKVSWRLE